MPIVRHKTDTNASHLKRVKDGMIPGFIEGLDNMGW
jgi:hypothetical protein